MVGRRWPECISDNRGRPRVRIRKDKRVVFDETLNVSIDTKSGLEQAIRLRDEVKHRLALGLAIHSNEQSERVLFADAAQAFIDQLDNAFSTETGYISCINSWWMPAFHNRMLDEITSKEIREIINSRRAAFKTKKNALIAVRGVFALYDINPNPANIKVRNTDQKEPVYRYRPEERNQLLSSLNGEHLVYFALLFGCGLRPSGEPLGLTWSDYDGTKLTIKKQIVRRKFKDTTKTYRQRQVVVPDWVKPILENHETRFRNGHIFLNSQGNPHRDADRFNLAWRAAHEKMGIPYRIPYTCRHTRAAELLSAGVEPMEAANQLGHSLEMFYRTYSEFIEEYCTPKDPDRFNGLAPDIRQAPKTSQVIEFGS